MKNLNKNPFAWAIVVILLGWWAMSSGEYEAFLVFVLAVIIAKLVEIINLHKGN